MGNFIGAEGVHWICKLVEGECSRGLSSYYVVHRGRRGFVRRSVNGEEEVVLKPSNGRHYELHVSPLMVRKALLRCVGHTMVIADIRWLGYLSLLLTFRSELVDSPVGQTRN